jgi:hypothetical protein
MIKKIFKAFSSLEFSKKLAVVVTALYISMLVVTTVFKILGTDITSVLEYVQYSFCIVLSGYILKSGAENVTKIKVSDLFKKSSEDTDTEDSTDISAQG